MASNTSSALDPTALPAQFLWPLRAAFWVVIVGTCLWMFCIAMQMFWAYRYAPDNPIGYTDQVLSADMRSTAAMTPLLIQPTALAWLVGNEIKSFTFDFVGDSIQRFAAFPSQMNQRNGQTARSGPPAPGTLLRQEHMDKVMLALTANYVFAARTALFIAALPLAVLLYAVSIADGLAARAVRRACAGRESSSLYHRGKLSQAFVVATTYVCFLALPNAVNPLWFVLPAAVACALLARLQATFYKKYL